MAGDDGMVGRLRGPTMLALSTMEHEVDVAWNASVSFAAYREPPYEFSEAELNKRLIRFGLIMAVGMAILMVVAVFALFKRKYGNMRKGISSTVAWAREQFQSASHYAYERLSAKEAWDDDALDRFVPQTRRDGVQDDAGGDELEALLRRRREAAGDSTDDLEAAGGLGKAAPQPLGALNKAGVPRQALAAGPAAEELQELVTIRALELRGSAAASLEENHGTRCSSENVLHASKLPFTVVLFVVYVALCVGIPLRHAKSVSCEQGLPWEAHMQFFALFIVLKFWELALLAFDTEVPGQLGVWDFGIKFCCSFLAILDGYSDANAIVVAHACGSPLWRWMAMCFVFGVVLVQWLMLGIASVACDSSKTCFFKMLHMDALAACCTMSPADQHALFVWKLVNIFRFLFEDLPQSVLQTLFVIHVKKNYVMICSIVLGVLSSAYAIVSAARRGVMAAGMHVERLRAKQAMRKALADRDAEAYFKAMEEAEEAGQDPQSMVHEASAAERAFGFKSGKPGCYVWGEVPLAETEQRVDNMVRDVPESDAYPTRRATVNMAVQKAEERERLRRERETKDSAAYQRGVHEEGRHVWRAYIARCQSRTVEQAQREAEAREKRIAKMLRPGEGVIGSRPKRPGEVASARWEGLRTEVPKFDCEDKSKVLRDLADQHQSEGNLSGTSEEESP